ncbi:sulfatase-like hydrolase/transferase [Formosa haliotis]|uniref:sulfatase-like hydrolase/transferase n=1 Tax=Formosa haliotis TaxID=1555194 RepID=UPI000A8B76CD|nr:sulfatase-like hydrolase/transferase [Formosa haliotis]
MKFLKNYISVFVLLCFNIFSSVAQNAPNILWIITDDHRPDAISAYNLATRGQKNSVLGYVSSPNIDKLASEGVLFTNAFTNSPACGPSRGSLISGRYPFRAGHYGFELTHQNPDFVKPSLGQTLQQKGYGTAQFGKTGEYIYKWEGKPSFSNAKHYEFIVHFKHDLQKNGIGDLWGKNPLEMVNGQARYTGTIESVKRPNGTIESYFSERNDGIISEADIKKRQDIENEFEILRSYTRSNPNLIIGGLNPMPANKTIDAMIVQEFNNYLKMKIALM